MGTSVKPFQFLNDSFNFNAFFPNSEIRGNLLETGELNVIYFQPVFAGRRNLNLGTSPTSSIQVVFPLSIFFLFGCGLKAAIIRACCAIIDLLFRSFLSHQRKYVPRVKPVISTALFSSKPAISIFPNIFMKY